MTVISENLADVAGVPDDAPVAFWTLTLRENDSGAGTTTKTRHQFIPVGGVLTTTDLDPGPAEVRIGSDVYQIVIPDSASPVRLWPLIDANVAPPDVTTGFVRNGGGVTRIQAVTQSDYDAIPTPDPATFYIVTE